MPTTKHPELSQFTPNLEKIRHELEQLMQAVKSKKHKNRISSLKKSVDSL